MRVDIRCLFRFHKRSDIPKIVNRKLQPITCERCGKGFGLLVASAESTRMTGLSGMPVERRQAAIDAMLRRAR